MSATQPGHGVDRLKSIRDPVTNTDLFVFDTAMPTIDLPLSRPSLAYSVPGADAPVDPYGIAGNPMAKRTLTYHWTQRLTAGPSAGMTYSAVLRSLMQACGDGRRVQLVRLDDAGQEWVATGKMTEFPLKIDLQSALAAEFVMTWELNPPVFRQIYPPNWIFLDTGRSLDETPPWQLDTNNLPNLPLVGTSNQTTITNAGDAEDAYPTITLTGPFPGLIGVALYAANGALRYYWTWNGALGVFDALVVSAALGTVRFNGQPAWGDGRFTNQSRGGLFGVPTGVSTLVVNTTNTVGAVTSFGGVQQLVLYTGGSGYTVAPAVTIAAPPSGTTATGHATISGGAVTSLVLDTAGAGYTAPPAVTIAAPPSGTTATGAALLPSAIVDYRSTSV